MQLFQVRHDGSSFIYHSSFIFGILILIIFLMLSKSIVLFGVTRLEVFSRVFIRSLQSIRRSFLNTSRLCSDLWLQERWEWLNFCPPCLVVSFFIRTYHGWLWEAEPPVNLFQHFIGLFRALLVLRRRGLGRRRKNHAASVGEYYQVRTTGPPALPVQAWHSSWSTILLDGTPKNRSQWGRLRFCSYRFSLISKWLKTSRPYNRSS